MALVERSAGSNLMPGALAGASAPAGHGPWDPGDRLQFIRIPSIHFTRKPGDGLSVWSSWRRAMPNINLDNLFPLVGLIAAVLLLSLVMAWGLLLPLRGIRKR